MFKMFKYIFMLIIILLLAISFDQIMMRSSITLPGARAGQQFYVDFRTRLVHLLSPATDSAKDSIGKVIETTTRQALQPSTPTQRYIYVDRHGVLQFADSLQDVPAEFRKEAQPLAD
jgi:hypothetical protein